MKKRFTSGKNNVRISVVSNTDDRAYKYRKVIGEESPSFIGQGAG